MGSGGKRKVPEGPPETTAGRPYTKMIYKSRGIAAIRSMFGDKKQICQVGVLILPTGLLQFVVVKGVFSHWLFQTSFNNTLFDQHFVTTISFQVA